MLKVVAAIVGLILVAALTVVILAATLAGSMADDYDEGD